MKKQIVTILLSLISISASAAEIGVYECSLENSNKKASLVYYPQGENISWMPISKLNTTKANSIGRLLSSGEHEFTLFGFQDQADKLVLPNDAQSLPSQMHIYTYHDNDDVQEDVQEFQCKKVLQ